ncbi:hypothetical protein SAMN02799631_05208 [Methylobacterium sp. 174MFSha1.1]|uniref:hypothetical protein n=1 Tax=Methylobacterium sp. 174MFSha1.1 TaxID=1502749 RepID=UPI0008F380AA|nr:hypothetical protein [Methylobacterium sp. 174MFSha1.1]SFV11087.1 hypothetical protein SAMN02799631_05208 [Methylobacterium sp. 174MFSha1.1]
MVDRLSSGAASLRKCVIAAAAVLPLIGLQAAPAQARDGGAIAAGIIGGLALGGLAAAAAAQPRYAYPYPAYGYPAYGYRRVYYAPARDCWIQRRRARDDFGNIYYRRVRVCG